MVRGPANPDTNFQLEMALKMDSLVGSRVVVRER